MPAYVDSMDYAYLDKVRVEYNGHLTVSDSLIELFDLGVDRCP